jgi:hypothetical protein
VHTYYKADVLANNWDYEGRDVNPEGFLEFIYSPNKFDKFRSEKDAGSCKAVGYKSFPNHYLFKSAPLMPLYRIFQEQVLGDPDVCKVILIRRDVIRTYVSSRRAFETGQYMTNAYQDNLITLDLVDFQRFVDRYHECYLDYRHKTQGHPRVIVTYEDLCQDPVQAIKPIWKLLGVADAETPPKSLDECVPQSAGALAPLRDSIANYEELEFACRHDPDLNQFLDLRKQEKVNAVSTSHSSGDSWDKVCQPDEEEESIRSDGSRHKWALLIPIRASSEDKVQDCRERVRTMYEAIVNTTASNKDIPLLIFGVDNDDPLYADGKLLREVCCSADDKNDDAEYKVVVKVYSGLQGRICRIWKRLAAVAYLEHDVDFTILLGDDVVLLDKGWQSSVEKRFATIAKEQNLPYGAACVALHDESFPGFPTFPVVHKWHFQTFQDILLPPQFDNQGGDPYLFELYKRIGASQFALECKLKNTIGGKY